MAQIQIRNVRKAFGATSVLQGVSLDVQDGEFISLVGPAGCGKSTLLRILAGLEKQDAGQVHMAGRCIDDLARRRLGFGLSFVFVFLLHMEQLFHQKHLRLHKVHLAKLELRFSSLRSCKEFQCFQKNH